MEISSPGLDEPLKLRRQYLKNIGRYVEIVLKSGIKTEGKLMNATDEEVVIEEEKGSKKRKKLYNTLFLMTTLKQQKFK